MEQSIVERAIETETDTKNRIRGVGKVGWFMSPDINCHIPTTEGEPAGAQK